MGAPWAAKEITNTLVGFAEATYRLVFAATPDPGGVQHIVNLLTSGTSRRAVAVYFTDHAIAHDRVAASGATFGEHVSATLAPYASLIMKVSYNRGPDLMDAPAGGEGGKHRLRTGDWWRRWTP